MKIFLLLTLLATSAFGANADLTWISATQNTDNTPIPATCTVAPCGRLVTTVVEYGTCSAPNVFGVKQGEITVASPAVAATVNMVVVQNYCFRVAHVNDYSMQGAFSNVVVKVNPAPVPNAPSGLTTPATVAYQVLPTLNRISLNAVGTVPAGTACDTSQSVNGLYAVPRDAVIWYGNVRPQVVVAACG